MKNIIIKAATVFILAASCNNKNTKTETSQAPADSNKVIVKEQAVVPSIKDILSAYLQLKNAFAKDNSSEAATNAKALKTAFENFDKTGWSDQQKKNFDDIQAEATEHAEHIGKHGGNIDHQRMHFESLSEDIYDLIKSFGAGQTLYKDFCPMYNDGKGAFWISEMKEIKNPYMGKSMSTCGVVKEEMK